MECTPIVGLKYMKALIISEMREGLVKLQAAHVARWGKLGLMF